MLSDCVEAGEARGPVDTGGTVPVAAGQYGRLQGPGGLRHQAVPHLRVEGRYLSSGKFPHLLDFISFPLAQVFFQ